MAGKSRGTSKLKGPTDGAKIVAYIRSNEPYPKSTHAKHQEKAIANYSDEYRWTVVGIFLETIRDGGRAKIDFPALRNALSLCKRYDAWLVFVDLNRFRSNIVIRRMLDDFQNAGGKTFAVESEKVVEKLNEDKFRRQWVTKDKINDFVKTWRDHHGISPRQINALEHYFSTNIVDRENNKTRGILGKILMDYVESKLSDAKIAMGLNTMAAVTSDGKKWSKRTVCNARQLWSSERMQNYEKVRNAHKKLASNYEALEGTKNEKETCGMTEEQVVEYVKSIPPGDRNNPPRDQ